MVVPLSTRDISHPKSESFEYFIEYVFVLISKDTGETRDPSHQKKESNLYLIEDFQGMDLYET